MRSASRAMEGNSNQEVFQSIGKKTYKDKNLPHKAFIFQITKTN